MCVIKPDGRLYIQSGIGNLGTASVSDTHRVTAEILGVPWEKCEITWGSTVKNLPWSCPSGGSQTTHAHTRAAYAVAMDAKDKLQQIAAKDLGGKPEDYEVANERVFRKGGGAGMTLAQAAKRAIELGGIYDGHELPKGINKMTVTSAQALAGQGLLAVARTPCRATARRIPMWPASPKSKWIWKPASTASSITWPWRTWAPSSTRAPWAARFSAAPCWASATRSARSGSTTSTTGCRWPSASTHNKPPTILDAPEKMQWAALDIPDPETPIGARGIGEPPVGAGCMAILNALSDALGDEIFRRAPVNGRHDSGFARSGQASHRRPHGPHLAQKEKRTWRSFATSCRPSSCSSRRPPTTRYRCSHRYGKDAWVMAGGLDTFDWLKDRIKRPKVVVDLSQIKELRGIRPTGRRARNRRHDHADRSGPRSHREGEVRPVSRGAELAASPQIRNQGTLGGNVSQDARCWYYRSGWNCYRAGGNICFADTPTAINREHAILGADRCVAVNPSDTAPALIALDAQMVIRNTKGERVVNAEDYFIGPGIDITRMTVLKPGDLLTAIRIPATWAGTQFYFEKIRDRQVWDFPLVNIASAAVFTGDGIDRIRIAVNGVAAHPVRLKNVEDAVTGKPRNAATADMAGPTGRPGRGAAAVQRLQSAAHAQSGEAGHSRRRGGNSGHNRVGHQSVGSGRPHPHRVFPDLGVGHRGTCCS